MPMPGGSRTIPARPGQRLPIKAAQQPWRPRQWQHQPLLSRQGGCLVQVGNGIGLEAVGLQFEPYRWRPCGVTWDSSRTVVVIKLRRTSALVLFKIMNSTGSRWSPVRTLLVAPLWCDLGFVPNSRGNKAAANLRPASEVSPLPVNSVELEIKKKDFLECLLS